MVRSATFLTAVISAFVLAGTASTASAQRVISMAPGTGCTNCGSGSTSTRVVSGSPVISHSPVISNPGQACGGSWTTQQYPAHQHPAQHSPTPHYSAQHSGTVVNHSASGAGNVLAALNAQRARQGLPALRYDPQLQAVASQRAQRMAASGNKNHPPGSFSPGRYEGVGWSSSFSPSGVSACYTSDPRMTVAGAAMATGRDGVYFCVVYR